MKTEELKAILLSEKAVQLAKVVLEKSAHVTRIRPVVRAYQNRILSEHRWMNTGEFKILEINGMEHEFQEKIVCDPEESYLLSEEDFNEYQQLCYQECVKVGLSARASSGEYCPLMIAEYEERCAKKEFMTYVVTYFPGYDGISADKMMAFSMEKFDALLNDCLNLIREYLKQMDEMQTKTYYK